MSDIAVGLFPGVVIVLLFQVVLPPSLTVSGYSLRPLMLPLAGVAILIGGLFVFLTPAHTTSLDWVTAMFGFYSGSTEHGHEEAKQYTQIERVHPDRGAIERTDGALVGMVSVAPPTMALATDEEWSRKAESFQNFLNTTVEFPIQIYSTTQVFPVEEYLGHYESRLGDADVESNPRMESLIEQYVEWYASELDERRMTIRDHYVIVPVTPAEVQFDRESLTQKLAGIPVCGLLIRAWAAPRIEDEREALFETLDDRLARIQQGLREIEGCNARRVDVDDATTVLTGFWRGQTMSEADTSQTLRNTPIVRGPER
jgi:hypothetical protein